jgi:biotin operon repressor
MNEDDLLAFAAASMTSLWSLELLLLLKTGGDRTWSRDQLIAELRSSETVVSEALTNLRTAGLITPDETGDWRYRPASPELGTTIDALQQLYRMKPAAIIRAIATAPNPKLRLLSNAFRISES